MVKISSSKTCWSSTMLKLGMVLERFRFDENYAADDDDDEDAVADDGQPHLDFPFSDYYCCCVPTMTLYCNC